MKPTMQLKLYSLVIFLMFTAVSIHAFPIPDTGITKCYDDTKEIPCPSEGQDFYGQDANYSINPMSYTKLDANGNDLPITATEWAMVRDNVTGLIWENNSHESTWDNAPNVITELNTAKFGGYSDWRLPTMTELGSIVDFSIPYPGPTINTNYFKDTILSYYWSSSTSAYSLISSAWGVNFGYGSDYSHSKYSSHYVRAVRGGQSVIRPFDPLVINGDRIVSDNTTGLMWQQDTAKTATGGTTMVWKDALAYCENLNLGGYTDWRLPTIKELRSIVDYTVYSPAINTNMFKDTSSSCYWSSSTYAYNISYAWGVSFYYGSDTSYDKYSSRYVRAVRDGAKRTKIKKTDIFEIVNPSPTPNSETQPAAVGSVQKGGKTFALTFDFPNYKDGKGEPVPMNFYVAAFIPDMNLWVLFDEHGNLFDLNNITACMSNMTNAVYTESLKFDYCNPDSPLKVDMYVLAVESKYDINNNLSFQPADAPYELWHYSFSFPKCQ